MATEKYKLTKTFVDNLPLSPDKQIFYKDSELLGFALRVTKSKSYIVEKKLPGGVTCRVTIGQHGVWTVAQAREQAREYLLMISKGINPNTIKKDTSTNAKQGKENNRQLPTLREAYDFYKNKKKLSTSSLIAYNICINNYFQDWADLKVTSLTKKMVQNRFSLLSERSPAQANLAIKFLHALFNYCSKHYLNDKDELIITTDNPAKIITQNNSLNKIKRRRTYVRSDQHHVWAQAVVSSHWPGEQNDDFRAYTNQDFLLLLALTGFRRNEAETLEWKNVDLIFGTIKVTDTKNGEDLMLPMGEVLWHILRERHKRASNLKYVFTDRSGKSHISDRRAAREKVAQESGIPFTFHDLRRTFSSVANSLAIGSYTIKRLINHTIEDNSNDVTDGYVQVSFDDLRKAMNLIEGVFISLEVKTKILNREYRN